MGYTSWSTDDGADEARPEREATNGELGGFDPYRAWLNVREVHRPLNAYQLLGLPTLEDDLDRIRAAAKLQRVAMQAHRFEASPEIWENVNSELEEAICILFDPDQKTAYDVSLRLHEEDVDKTPQRTLGAVPNRGQSGTLLCSHCRTPASATRRFCGNCGSPLWEPCFRCGTLAMAGEKFCGACGANVLTGIEEQIQLFGGRLREADQLRAEHRYEEAVALLTPFTKMEHSRLQPYIRRAHETIRAINDDRQRAQERADQIYHEAQQRAEDGDYEGVVHLLEAVPAALRHNATGHLLDEMRMRLAQITELDQQIREAVSANRVSDVLPLVDRLLTIKPDHPNALKLAGKFRDHFVRLSQAKLAQFQHEAAVGLLDQVPQAVRNEAWQQIHRKAAELVWLTWDLRNAPVVDPTLVAFAERLLRQTPDNAKAKGAWEELQRRSKLRPTEKCELTIPWMSPPKENYLGYPIDWLTGFQRIGVKTPLDGTPLREHPGCFFVAAGLALQGLGKAAAKLNLLPSDRGVLGTVTQLWRMRPTRGAWGLDLSSSGLKAVRLSMDSQQVFLEACDFIEHKKLLSQAVNEEEEKTLIEETIKIFLSRNDIKSCRICLGLPSRMVLVRQLKMPPLDEAKMASALQLEARRLMPLPLEELVWGHELLEPACEESRKEVDVALVAAKRLQLKDRLTRLEAQGLPVDLVQCDFLALRSLLNYEFGPDSGLSNPVFSEEDPDAVIAVVDLGSDASSIQIISPRLSWLYTSGLGSHHLTKAFVREFQSTAIQAEELKRNPAMAEALDPVLTTMNAVFEDFAKEIQAALTLFSKAHRNNRVERLLGVGGGFQIHGLLRYLRLGR